MEEEKEERRLAELSTLNSRGQVGHQTPPCPAICAISLELALLDSTECMATHRRDQSRRHMVLRPIVPIIPLFSLIDFATTVNIVDWRERGPIVREAGGMWRMVWQVRSRWMMSKWVLPQPISSHSSDTTYAKHSLGNDEQREDARTSRHSEANVAGCQGRINGRPVAVKYSFVNSFYIADFLLSLFIISTKNTRSQYQVTAVIQSNKSIYVSQIQPG